MFSIINNLGLLLTNLCTAFGRWNGGKVVVSVLNDAKIELDSAPGVGTTISIVF